MRAFIESITEPFVKFTNPFSCGTYFENNFPELSSSYRKMLNIWGLDFELQVFIDYLRATALKAAS